MKTALFICLLGLGLLVVAWAGAAYPLLDYPFLDEGDVPKLIVGSLGGAWALWGGIQALRLAEGKAGRLLAGFLMVLGLLGCAGLFAFMLVATRMIPPPADVKAGQAVADFSLPDQSGKTFKLSDLKGKPVVLIFTRGFW